MKQVDSNIVIDATKPEGAGLDALLLSPGGICVSAITAVEVLGYHGLDAETRRVLDAFFAVVNVLPVDDVVLRKAIELRLARKMSLGDSLIAATALVHHLPLVTRNTADFLHVAGLIVIDPDRAS